MSPERDQPSPEPAEDPEDPRLRIPDVLREQPGGPGPRAPAPTPAQSLGESAKAWGIALDLVFMTVGGLLLGWLIDRWLGTDPAGALIGLALGFVLGFVRLIRISLRAEAKDRAGKDQSPPAGTNRPRP